MYTQKYGLRQRPFENTPDPQFLFLSRIHREVLSSLIYGIQSSKGFILVSGDIGTGKTTLIHALLKEVQHSNIVLHIINPRTNFKEIISNLSQKLNIESKGLNSTQLIDIIRKKLKLFDDQGKRAIIIIDEAHLLSEASLEDIRILSNIETEKRKLVQIILVGQNEIHDSLNQDSQKPLKQRIVLNRRLTPFNKKTSFEYIKYRLEIAGTRSTIFNQQALNKIWEKSCGIPRLINQICDNALLIGFAMDKNIIGAKIIKEVIEDMESGEKSIPRDIKNTGYKRALGLVAVFVIVSITMLLIIDPQTLSTNFINQNHSHQNTGTKTLEFKIIKEVPDTPAMDIIEKKKIPDEKQETYSISKTREKLSIKPVLDIESNTDRFQNNALNRQKQIKPNEYLLNIAKKEYGTGSDMIIDLIHMANPEIKNVNKIFIGKKLVLPFIEKKDLIVKNKNKNFHIHYTSYYNYSEASKTIQKLSKENKLVFTLPVRQGENLVYRVYIGVFTDKNIAAAYLNKLNFDHLPFL